MQPFQIVALAALALLAFSLARWWHRAGNGRPPLHLDVAALSLLALLTGGFFWRVLTESKVWMPAGGGDLASLYYPAYVYVSEQLRAGSLPLWNPHVFAGMPLAADAQTGLFYPLNWLLYLFSYPLEYRALEWMLIVHYWLASAFTYLFLRDIGLGRLGALAGAVAFAFCGFMTAHLGHMPMIFVAAWIPLALLLMRRALLSRAWAGWAWAVAAGLCLALALLAGHVQIFSYGLLAAALMWLYLLLGERSLTVRNVLPWVAKGALMLGVALGVGAVQLLPSLQLSRQSVRAAISYEEASAFAAQPITLINLILPRVFGSNPTNYLPGQWQNTENWAYCGVITLALAGAGLVLRRGRMVGFFALLTVLSILIMVGDLSIVGAWIYKFVPGFGSLRSSGRALVLLGLGLAGLAGYGLDGVVAALRARDVGVRRSLLWWLVGVSGALAILGLGVLPAFYKEAIIGGQGEFGRLPGAINDLGMTVFWLGLLAGVGWAAYRGRLEAVWAGVLIVGLLVLDIFSPNSRFNPTTTDVTAGYSKHFEAINLLAARSRDDRTGIPLRINSDTDVQEVWQPNTALYHGYLYDAGGAFNPLKLQRYDFLLGSAKSSPNTPLYDLAGGAFEVISATTTITRPHAGEAKWVALGRFGEVEIFENKNTLPRAYLVHEAQVQAGGESTVTQLRRFDVDPRHTVLLESGATQKSNLMGTAEAYALGWPTDEFVRATRYSPNAVDLTVRADAPGWVVLTDAWYPGWEATVDGQPATIEPAYYAFRAIRVEAGEHKISMQFRPPTWVWGRIISLVSLAGVLLGLGALFLLARRSQKRMSVQGEHR